MSYPINLTNSTKLFDLLDGTTNSETGLTLIGRNYTNYGEFQNENFIRLLENFASDNDPSQNGAFNPVKGTLWYDTANKRLRVYDGANWVSVSERSVSNTAPVFNKIGDQWYDTIDKQLKSWDGTQWQVVGPPYKASQGKSGSVVETIRDTAGVDHTVVATYTNGNLITIQSFGATFTPQTLIPGFGNIKSGINVRDNSALNGLAEDSQRLGGLFGNVYARTDIDDIFEANLSVAGRLTLTSTYLQYVGGNSRALQLVNTNLYGNVEVFVNSATNGNIKAVSIDGDSGQLMTYGLTPGHPNHVTNKAYVDAINQNLQGEIDALSASTTTKINQLATSTTNNLNTAVSQQTANLLAVQTALNNSITTLDAQFQSNVVLIDANLAIKTNQIDALNLVVPTLAPLDSAVLVGTPTVPTADLQSNNSVIASTAYVDRQAAVTGAAST